MDRMTVDEARTLRDSTRRFAAADQALRSAEGPDVLPEAAEEYLAARADHARIVADAEDPDGEAPSATADE